MNRLWYLNMLSSDVLEKQFGSTDVEVLRHDTTTRIIQTLSRSSQILEVSWVTFDPDGVGSFPEIYSRMGEGASMGKAFREGGVDFIRNDPRTTRANLPFFNRNYFGTDGESTIIEVDIVAGPEHTRFAGILEVYSPAVKWPVSPSGGTNRPELLDRLRQFEVFLLELD